MRTIINEKFETVYYSASHNKIVDDSEALNISLNLKINDYHNLIDNGLNTLRNTGKYKYFVGLASIPPRSIIKAHDDYYEVISCLDKNKYDKFVNKEKLLKEVTKIIGNFSNAKVGVELSGGLDSSLIIEALLKNNIDPILIGFTSDKFEFRTERIIQDYYKKKVSDSILLKYEDCYAFDNLTNVPSHPIPVCNSHFFYRHTTMARVAKKNNLDILFSGEAGDQLFGFESNLNNFKMTNNFNYWNLAEHWSDQYVYRKYGVKYLSAIALGSLPSMILSLRFGQKKDPMKLWARNYFKDCLPKELSNYAYTAYHDGWVMDGLLNALESILEMSQKTYDKFKIENLHPSKMKDKSLVYCSLGAADRKKFLLNLSFVVWYYKMVQ